MCSAPRFPVSWELQVIERRLGKGYRIRLFFYSSNKRGKCGNCCKINRWGKNGENREKTGKKLVKNGGIMENSHESEKLLRLFALPLLSYLHSPCYVVLFFKSELPWAGSGGSDFFLQQAGFLKPSCPYIIIPHPNP